MSSAGEAESDLMSVYPDDSASQGDYGRGAWVLGEDGDQVVVQGTDRRSYASLNALGRMLDGPGWRRWHGFRHAEVHEGHAQFREATDDVEWEWTARSCAADAEGALPVLWCDL